MSYKDVISADVRLTLLLALEQDPDYSHNEHVLSRMLDAVGHGISSDRLHTHLAWLEEQGLLQIDRLGDLQIARLTRRGADVAVGRARVPGVARPRPDA